MVLPATQESREYANFSDNGDSTTSRFVKIIGSGISFTWDSFSVAYPTSSSEIYSFFSGGLSGTLKGTATLIYTSSTKENLLSGEISVI